MTALDRVGLCEMGEHLKRGERPEGAHKVIVAEGELETVARGEP